MARLGLGPFHVESEVVSPDSQKQRKQQMCLIMSYKYFHEPVFSLWQCSEESRVIILYSFYWEED